jgi:hypothetical protein
MIVGIFGGFARCVHHGGHIRLGEAATTAANVLANSGLVCIGVVALALPPLALIHRSA